MQEVPVHLPMVMASIQGSVDADHFIIIGFQLGNKQQEKIINELIRAYTTQMENGWRPRFVFYIIAPQERSVLRLSDHPKHVDE